MLSSNPAKNSIKFLTFLRKTMESIEVKNFTNGADEVSTPSNARVETVNVGVKE